MNLPRLGTLYAALEPLRTDDAATGSSSDEIVGVLQNLGIVELCSTPETYRKVRFHNNDIDDAFAAPTLVTAFQILVKRLKNRIPGRELTLHAFALRVSASDLDEAVHDCVQEVNLAELNALADEAEQEDHIDSYEKYASDINNGGLEGQIQFLLLHNTYDEVKALIDEAV